jgi:hypothetical protein
MAIVVIRAAGTFLKTPTPPKIPSNSRLNSPGFSTANQLHFPSFYYIVRLHNYITIPSHLQQFKMPTDPILQIN